VLTISAEVDLITVALSEESGARGTGGEGSDDRD
jgi:hypothetical protein